MGETTIIGMSPANSYFSEERIKQLVRWAIAQGKQTYIVIPDRPAVHTYRAKGASNPKSKARQAGNALRNKCARSIDVLASAHSPISLLHWQHIEETDTYASAHNCIYSLYNQNNAFKLEVRTATQSVMEHGASTATEDSIDIGVHFLLEELAGILAIPGIVGNKISYIYHRPWPVFEKLIAGDYTGHPISNVQFKLVRFPEIEG